MTAADGNLTAALGWTALGGSVVDHGLQERRNTASVEAVDLADSRVPIAPNIAIQVVFCWQAFCPY